MRNRPLGILAFALATGIPGWAQSVQPSVPANAADTGFFRAAPDPALTTFRAAPVPPAPGRVENPGQPVDMAVEIRKVEEARIGEAQMDRSEQDHERARAEAAATATAPAAAVAVGTPAPAMPAGVPYQSTR